MLTETIEPDLQQTSLARWDDFDTNLEAATTYKAVADLLKESKTCFFESLASGDPCDLLLLWGPEGICSIDGVCSTIISCHEVALKSQVAGRTALVVPVIAMQRSDFVQTALESWLDARGISETALVFSDDVVEVVETARAVASETVLIEVVRMPSRPLVAADSMPGAKGCHSSFVANALICHASALEGGLFESVSACGGALFLEALELAREAIAESSNNFSFKLQDISWSETDEDVVRAISALLVNQS